MSRERRMAKGRMDSAGGGYLRGGHRKKAVARVTQEERTHSCDDIPKELQEDFLTVCGKHGVSFYWLCEVYRQGRGVATAQYTEGPPVRDEASPNTIARYSRESAHATFNGGHHDEPAHSAFHHGMDTVFNIIEADALASAPAPSAVQELEAERERIAVFVEALRDGYQSTAMPVAAVARAIRGMGGKC